MQNIAGYVLDHTSRDEGRWHGLAPGRRGPYLVSPRNGPRMSEFLRLVRLHRERSPGCNPLDGREHGFGEVARWIGATPLAVRFVGLGVILGVFELASPWEALPSEGRDEVDRRAGQGDGWRFRRRGSRPGAAIGLPAVESARCRKPQAARRPRWTRGGRART